MENFNPEGTGMGEQVEMPACLQIKDSATYLSTKMSGLVTDMTLTRTYLRKPQDANRGDTLETVEPGVRWKAKARRD
jgi:hypothetical protein